MKSTPFNKIQLSFRLAAEVCFVSAVALVSAVGLVAAIGFVTAVGLPPIK